MIPSKTEGELLDTIIFLMTTIGYWWSFTGYRYPISEQVVSSKELIKKQYRSHLRFQNGRKENFYAISYAIVSSGSVRIWAEF